MIKDRSESSSPHPRWIARAAAALLLLPAALSTCKPTPDPPSIAAPVETAPCKATLATDTFNDEGIDTRTGCLLVTMTLGSVAGAADLSLPVGMIRNEGNVPPAVLYPSAWFGAGVWLTIDEYVTKEKDDLFTLHTPSGDVVYDFLVAVPDADNLDPNDDTKSKIFREFRTRPFDGTFLWDSKEGYYYITVGNPADSRSLVKKYQTPLPGKDKSPSARLLTRIEKASIYKGPRNYIAIDRKYGPDAASITFTSSLFEGSGIVPLVVNAGAARTDGKPGYQTTATTTLLHGWSSTVTALANERGNVERLLSGGRNANERHQTSFAYSNEETPASTVFKSILEEEGSDAELRTMRSLEIKERADGASKTWPFAVKTLVDHSRPGADLTEIVSECPHELAHPSDTMPTYFTFNGPDGTSAAFEYGDDTARNMLVRSRDAYGKNIELQYNLARGGGDPGKSQPVTAFELKYMWVSADGAPEQQFSYRFDKFSADTYGLPMIGKVSTPLGMSADKQVYYRAVYGDKNDEYNGGRPIRTFAVPRIVAGADGRTRWEHQGLDGFTYESWDEDGVMLSFRWVDQDKGKDGKTYDKETIDVSLMGVLQSRVTRDRFGRLLQRIDYDPSLAANAQPTTKYNITKEGFTDRIDDSGSGETFAVQSWNGPRSAITAASVTRMGQPVTSFTLATDDFGNRDGAGTVTLGPLKITTTTARAGAGLFKSESIVGPSGQALTSELGYADKDIVPNQEKMNGQAAFASTPKPMTAKGGCK